MELMRYRSYREEFPFLPSEEDFQDPLQMVRDLRSILIKKIDLNLLDHIPCIDSASGSLIGIYDEEWIDFILEDGTILQDAVLQNYQHYDAGRGDAPSKEGESILSAIYRLNIADKVKFIVSYRKGYEIIDHHSTDAWEVAIYKLPKNLSLSEIISERKEKIKSEIKAQSDF